jgi:hypothetical protein
MLSISLSIRTKGVYSFAMLILPKSIEAGIKNDTRVRTVDLEGVKRVSALDVIKLMIDPRSSASVVWSRVTEQFPDLLQGMVNYRFSGAGQRPTPTINAQSTVMLMNVIPGKCAVKFRLHCADIVVRFLGGDETLISDVHRNADIQENLHVNHPYSIFGADVKRRRDDADSIEESALRLRETRARVMHMELNVIREGADLLKMFDPTGNIDAPVALILKDATQNALALQSNDEHGTPKTDARHQMSVSDLYHKTTGNRGNNAIWLKIGKALSKEYRRLHQGKPIPQVERRIDGTTRMINVYSTIEDPWIEEFIKNLV